MVASISGTQTTVPTASLTGVSKTKASRVSLSLRGVADSDYAAGCVVLGKSASVPATYADLANPTSPARLDPSNDDWDTYSSRTPDGYSTWTISMSGTAPLGNAAWSPGDTVYWCAFAVNPPISGSVPIAVLGPLTVIA